MKYSNSFLCTICIALTLVSCKKETPQQQSIIAGSYNNSDYHIQFDPPKTIEIQWDTMILYGHGMDSLDLDNDLQTDVILSLNIINTDSLHLLQNQIPDPFPSLRISGKGNISIAKVTEYAYAGLGTVAEFDYADTIAAGTVISQALQWQNIAEKSLSIWGEHPGSLPGLSFGPWYDHAEAFIGFYINGHFGWIRLDTSDPYEPKILEIACSQ